MLDARRRAERGFADTLVWLTGRASARAMTAPIGTGSVETIRVHGRKHLKKRFVERLIWTFASNLALLRAAFAAMRGAALVLLREARRLVDRQAETTDSQRFMPGAAATHAIR